MHYDSRKVNVIPWPDELHDIGYSGCMWPDLEARPAIRRILESLPPCPVYLELGVFTGVGSTLPALEAREDLTVVGIDSFRCHGPNIINSLRFGKFHDGDLCDYLKGVGSCREHFQNNLFEHRDRVTLIDQEISEQLLADLKATGLEPRVIFIDDDHSYEACSDRIQSCRKLWPKAITICDDYIPRHAGVIKAVDEAVATGIWREEHMSKVGGRTVIFRDY